MTSFTSREEITDYVERMYGNMRGPRAPGTRLPLDVAEPDVLIEEAIRLSGAEGVTDAVLRRVVPVAEERFERGLWRLQEADRIQRQKERRHDRALRMREQVVWYLTG